MCAEFSQPLSSEPKANSKYVVISPVRNEEEYIEKTLESMIQQTIRPHEWIIVNDGSTDRTAEIVSKYAEDNSWMRLINNQDRGARQRGKGVVEAFYFGYDVLIEKDYNFIVKLDGDLSFGPTYFESLLQEFASRPKLGITGGGIYEKLDGRTWKLCASVDHVRGPTKMYRRSCFEAIGGLDPALGWDGADEWKALTIGLEVQTLIELKVLHHRPTGAATGGIKSRIEEGYGAYYMGYQPLFLLARGVRNIFIRPYVIGGIAMIIGYFSALLQRREQIPDKAVIRFVRRTQLRQLFRLMIGKPIHKKGTITSEKEKNDYNKTGR